MAKYGFAVDMEGETVKNTNFRKVLYTGPHSQLVLMALKPGEDIGMETHTDLDQFIRIDGGSGEAVIAERSYPLRDGSAIVIPAGSKHNVIAGAEGLKLYAVYSKPNHPDKVVDRTKGDAMKREDTLKKSRMEGYMKKSSIALVIIPGELSKAANMQAVGVSGRASHPAGTSAVSGNIKSPIPYTGHEERMKFAKMAMERMLGSSAPEDEGKYADVGFVDRKGMEPDEKPPYSNYSTNVSGMGSRATGHFAHETYRVKPSELGSGKPESASAHQPRKTRKPKS